MMIRKADKDDLKAMLEVDVKCGSIVVARLGISKTELKDTLSQRFNEKNKDFYVYEDNGIKGYVCLKLEFPGHNNCELAWVAVLKEEQHKGIGKKLVRFIENIAGKKGFRNIYAYTSEKDNKEAHKFYLSLGYKKINALEDYYSDGSRAVLFGKKLR